ncbi:hypothetical protein D9Q98_003629 [Chlorella vulgaris]|uniref:RRM domain-containing protein n=1 Tax=Chlorella vulgaris TaxID=3077 RepID=A0A9D4TUE1_CHLVU|nr:hypothetical protein D9Q98_003629 [Chlorella vulgaris]
MQEMAADGAAPPQAPAEHPQEPEEHPATSRICVKNLPKYVDDRRLREHFAAKGEVTDAKVMRTRDGKSRCFGFVGFRSPVEAEAALRYFSKSFLDTMRLDIEEKKKGRGPLEEEADPKLKEFMQVMQPRSRQAIWTIDDLLPPGTSATAAATAAKQQQQAAAAAAEGGYDDEYEELPAGAGAAATAAATRSSSSSEGDSDSDDGGGEAEEEGGDGVVRNAAVSDLDYLKSRVKASFDSDDEAFAAAGSGGGAAAAPAAGGDGGSSSSDEEAEEEEQAAADAAARKQQRKEAAAGSKQPKARRRAAADAADAELDAIFGEGGAAAGASESEGEEDDEMDASGGEEEGEEEGMDVEGAAAGSGSSDEEEAEEEEGVEAGDTEAGGAARFATCRCCAGYAVLRYNRAPRKLPTTPPPQPGTVAPWTTEQTAQIVMSSVLLNSKDKSAGGGVYRTAMSKMPPATLTVLLNITQPLMNQTGQLRWAINNVAMQSPPPCEALLDLVYENPSGLKRNVVPASLYNKPNAAFNSSAVGVQEAKSGRIDVFLTTNDKTKNPPPIYPTAGTHVLPLKKGEVLELVIQNLNANSNNGDYRVPAGANRTAQEQRPFHLHGHHFWVVGSGLGIYNAKANASSLNTVNPPWRDTATLPQGGWVVIRFKADNPGLWLLHCHLFMHQLMGQLLVVAEDTEGIQKLERPTGLPECPATCVYNGAPWSNSAVQKEFGDSGFELPAGGR